MERNLYTVLLPKFMLTVPRAPPPPPQPLLPSPVHYEDTKHKQACLELEKATQSITQLLKLEAESNRQMKVKLDNLQQSLEEKQNSLSLANQTIACLQKSLELKENSLSLTNQTIACMQNELRNLQQQSQHSVSQGTQCTQPGEEIKTEIKAEPDVADGVSPGDIMQATDMGLIGPVEDEDEDEGVSALSGSGLSSNPFPVSWKSSKNFSCLECGKRYRFRWDLLEHQRRRHKENKDERPRSPSPSSSDSSWDQPEPPLSSLPSSSTSTASSNQQQNRHTCPKCRLRLESALQFRVHWIVHTGQPPYPCPWCGRVFAKIDRIFSHMSLAHAASRRGRKRTHLACERCSKRFTSESDLKKHDPECRRKDRKKVIACPLCTKKFCSQLGLAKHVSTRHSDHPPPDSTVAIAHSNRNTTTTTPKRNITTTRPPPPRRRPPSAYFKSRREAEKRSARFLCQLCPACFVDEDLLNEHIRKRHSKDDDDNDDEKITTATASSLPQMLFSCAVCREGFASAAQRDVHERVTHPDKSRHAVTTATASSLPRTFSCAVCREGFLSVAQRDVHERATHPNTWTGRCRKCGESFTVVGKLRAHKGRVHGRKGKPLRDHGKTGQDFNNSPTRLDLATGCVEDGHTVDPEDGRVDPTNGHIVPEDRQADPTNGRIDPDDGRVDPTNGPIDPVEGYIYLQDGHVVDPDDGHIVDPTDSRATAAAGGSEENEGGGESVNRINTEESIKHFHSGESVERMNIEEAVKEFYTEESVGRVITEERVELVHKRESVDRTNADESVKLVRTEGFNSDESVKDVYTEESIPMEEDIYVGASVDVGYTEEVV